MISNRAAIYRAGSFDVLAGVTAGACHGLCNDFIHYTVLLNRLDSKPPEDYTVHFPLRYLTSSRDNPEEYTAFKHPSIRYTGLKQTVLDMIESEFSVSENFEAIETLYHRGQLIEIMKYLQECGVPDETLQFYLEDYPEVLEALGIEHVYICGPSEDYTPTPYVAPGALRGRAGNK